MIRKRYERIPFVAFFFAFVVAKAGVLDYLGTERVTGSVKDFALRKQNGEKQRTIS